MWFKSLFKSWKQEYTIIGLLVIIVGLVGALVDLPAKVMDAVGLIFGSKPPLDVQPISGLQTTLTFDRSRITGGYSSVSWNIVLEITNVGKDDVTLTHFDIPWEPVNLEGQVLQMEQVRDYVGRAIEIEVYETEADLRYARGDDAPGESAQRLPHTLGAGEKRVFVFHLEYELYLDNNPVTLGTEADLIQALVIITSVPITGEGDYRCVFMDVPVVIEAWEYAAFRKDVQTAVFIPGCVVQLPELK